MSRYMIRYRMFQSSRPVTIAAVFASNLTFSLAFSLALNLALNLTFSDIVAALPPPEDTPEEILRNRQHFDARSPVDGQPLSAAEYARLQAELRALEEEPPLSANVQQTIFLLRILKAVRVLTPF